MNYRNRGFDPEQFFGPDGPFGPRGPLGPGGIFGPGGPFGTGGAWPSANTLFGDSREGRRGPGRPGPRGGHGGPRRAPRGAVRNAILELLAREPMNGYELMQGIAEATEGDWTPSSGAIYPALSQLEDEGLIEQFHEDGRRSYRLTDAGREASDSGPSPLAGYEPQDPWAADERRRARGARGPREGREHGRRGGRGPGGTGGLLWKAVGGVAMATQAVGQAGDEPLAREAAELLDRTRRDLYRMLAEAEVAKDEPTHEHDEDTDDFAEGEIIED